MNKFRWGRMNAPDVYLDYYTRRTISIIKVRNLFARLAMSLVQEGKKDSAVAVVDRSMELLPKEKMPYSIFTLGQIEAYYAAGAKEKADSLATDYAGDLKAELNYYYSFPRDMASSLEYPKKVSLQLLQQTAITCKKYNEKLGKELEDDVNRYYTIYLQSAGSGRN